MNLTLGCRSGLARGFAFAYLKKAADVDKVIEYVDGRHLRSRQIRAKKALGVENNQNR